MAVESYKCPNCDGGLTFSPEKQKLVCEYCGSAFTKEELEARLGEQADAPADSWEEMESRISGEQPPEQEAAAPESSAAEPGTAQTEQTPEDDGYEEHMAAYTCPSCGAEVIVDDTTAATYCFYCHNPVVLSGRLSGKYRPRKLIPFQIDRKGVEDAFHSWCRKKWFIDRNFCSDAQMEKMTGVYLPFWLIDSKLDATLTATGTKVRIWRAGDMEYTETKIYRITREGEVDYREFPIAALSKRTMELVQGVYPYDFSKAIDFSMPYLSGFQAEKRTLERENLEGEIHGEMERGAQKLLENTVYGYGGMSGKSVSASFQFEDWKYCLLPAWILTYHYKEKDYYFAMNGQNGKICGGIPTSWKRLLALFLGVSAALFLILMLGGWLL